MKDQKNAIYIDLYPDKGAQTLTTGRVYGADRWLVRRFLHSLGSPQIRVSLWDGTKVMPEDTKPAAGMLIRNRSALWRLMANPMLNFGDEYSTGGIEIQGGLVLFMQTVYRALAATSRYRPKPDPAAYRRHQPNLNSVRGSRHNIHCHYDIGNAFYKLWLDAEMLYTCAYFSQADASLEEAQFAKMEIVSRKLHLQAGQTVVEAGCGWGGLARHMARRFGVKVRAYNISREQIAYARQRAKDEGLEGRIEYIEDDYRTISGQYDAFVSVGMLEHVGPDHYQELGKIIARCLKQQGLGLIHTIGQNAAIPMNPWFLKRIFPGSYPPTLQEISLIFEAGEFTVLDVENLRLHYAETCRQWLDRFEQNLDRIQEMFDETFIRAWRLYLSGCIANFNIGDLLLYQVVFSRATNNQIPLTRSCLCSFPGQP